MYKKAQNMASKRDYRPFIESPDIKTNVKREQPKRWRSHEKGDANLNSKKARVGDRKTQPKSWKVEGDEC
jgi:hypothetical protein